MTFSHSIIHVAVLLSVSLIGAVAAEGRLGRATAPAEDSTEPYVLPSEESEPISLPRATERRDIFYDILSIEEAKVTLAELEAESQNLPGQLGSVVSAPEPDQVADGQDELAAVRFAAQSVTEVQSLMRDEAWEQAMGAAEKRLSQLQPHIATFPNNEKLAQAEATLQTLYGVAEDRKLYEEARSQFEALDLRVEGIMWSAEGSSLALISGEPVARSVNDRVRSTVIKNIDQNRVDFLYSYRQRQYHFQLYLEPKD